MAFSRDGTRIVTACEDKTARVWDPASGRQLARLAHSDSVRGVAFSPDGTLIVTASDKIARVWDASKSRQLARLAHSESVCGVAFSPDGTLIATASWDRTARLWDAATGSELVRLAHEMFQVNAVVFSPDGTRFATATDGYREVHQRGLLPALLGSSTRTEKYGYVAVWGVD